MEFLVYILLIIMSIALYICTGSAIFIYAAVLLWSGLRIVMDTILHTKSNRLRLAWIGIVSGVFYGFYYYGSHVEGTDWEIIFILGLLYVTVYLMSYQPKKGGAEATDSVSQTENLQDI